MLNDVRYRDTAKLMEDLLAVWGTVPMSAPAEPLQPSWSSKPTNTVASSTALRRDTTALAGKLSSG